jgi:basic amino acid/polyamine antiporter, APA family
MAGGRERGEPRRGRPVPPQGQLRRDLHTGGAVLMGLGSIVGTGVFVSLGVAAGIAGPSVLLAVVIGGLVASFNGLSSAQLAAAHPVSGGTYEYGYKYLNPTLGFSAGWMFLLAKSASAATAALGFAGYLLNLAGASSAWGRTALAVGAVAVLTAITVRGIRQSHRTNVTIVSITLVTLTLFVLFGLPTAADRAGQTLGTFFDGGEDGVPGLLYASALMFVAYTGYGRIATLGEEVAEPERTIPRAIIIALVATVVLYVAVAFVAVASVGAPAFGAATDATAAPLEVVARSFPAGSVLAPLLALGAVTAMLGVLLNLLLGLSRVLLAMGRRGDAPDAVAHISARFHTPSTAIVVMGVAVMALALVGDVKTTWSFSAFTVLVYYALTNLAALRLPPEHRRFPRWIAWAGLLSCIGLAFWVEPVIWLSGLALLAAGHVMRFAWRRFSGG